MHRIAWESCYKAFLLGGLGFVIGVLLDDKRVAVLDSLQANRALELLRVEVADRVG